MSGMIDIADVAESAILIEDCGPSRRPVWAARPGRGRPGMHNPFLDWETMGGVAIRHWRLRNVVLDGDTFLLFHQGRVIRQSNYHRHPPELEAARVHPDRLVQLPDDGPILVCGDDWSTNHYHFLNHTLPAIHAVAPTVPGLRLIGHPMRPVHARMVALLGHAHFPLIHIERGRQYAIPDAIFCDFTMGHADFACSAFVQGVADALAGQVADDGARKGRIYVSRMADTHRHMAGEAALAAGLERRGFRIFAPAGLSMEQQISAFRGAHIVVGPHGAGLANIAFCRPGTLVYDLLPAHFTDPSILTLAIRRGAVAWVDAFASETSVSDHVQDWQVDVAGALARVDALMARRWFGKASRLFERSQRR